MADGTLSLQDFWKLSSKERGERYSELSDHDKMTVRISDPGIPSKRTFVPCNRCIHRNKGTASCHAYPDGISGEHISFLVENPAIECGTGYHFMVEESSE